MNIEMIIQEEIDRYLNESLIDEAKKKKKKKSSSKKKKSSNKKKKKISSKYARQHDKASKRDGNNVSAGDEKQIQYDVTNNDLINVAALAKKVYPDHTPEGAQSQLRKKLKGLKNDNGSKYHIKQREAGAIRRALKNI